MNLFDALVLIVCLCSFKYLRDLGLSRNHDGKLSAAELRSWRGFKGSEILREFPKALQRLCVFFAETSFKRC